MPTAHDSAAGLKQASGWQSVRTESDAACSMVRSCWGV